MQRILILIFPTRLPRAAPSFLFYDNNCHLLMVVQNNREASEIFKYTAFPVDVFHAVNKHQASDEFCNTHCNPALFPDLWDIEAQKWVFNASAAEQTNVWYGKFLPVVREMSQVHFNFFLDEMITIHNAFRATKLEELKARPRLVPLDELAVPFDQ